MADDDNVCVVTQPVSSASQSHVFDLLDIISAITSVSLVTANLPAESNIRDQYDVTDIASEGTGDSISVAAFRFLRNQLRMAKVLWNRDEGIVLFFGATSYLFPIIVAKLSGKTVVIEPRGNVPLSLRLRWEKRVPQSLARVLAGSVWLLEEIGYRLSDAIVTYTPLMAAELGVNRFEAKLYPNGARYVNTEEFSPRVSYEERDEVIGFLGRLDEEKRIKELAAVAEQLPEDITFVFAGDGERRDWLEQKLSREIADGSVELTGWVNHNEVPEVLSRFKLLILPSEPTEGLPTVILEAMATGTPVFATPVSGVPDIVREGETGFLIETVEPKHLVRDLNTILERDDLAEISSNCRELIEEEYGFAAAVNRYSMILQSIS